jgi:hypothetical protein
MPEFKVNISHKLQVNEAMNKAHALLQEIKQNNADKISDLSEAWSADGCKFSFKIMGFPLSGSIHIGSSDVEISGKIPFMALPFKSTIESSIRQKAVSLLG